MPNNGYMFMIGTEYDISDNWSVIFSNTWHKSTRDKMNFDEFCGVFGCIDGEPSPLDTRINYNRFSLSLVYMISDKINKRPSRDRRVGGSKR